MSARSARRSAPFPTLGCNFQCQWYIRTFPQHFARLQALLGDIEIVAQLNLKAGSRSKELSDKASALNFYQFGIDNVNCVGLDQRWGVSLYEVALKLHTAAVETACALNDAATVMKLSKDVVDNSKGVEGKLACESAPFLCGNWSLY